MSCIDMNIFDRTQGNPHMQSTGSWRNGRTYITVPLPVVGATSCTTAPEVCPHFSIEILEELTVRITMGICLLSVPICIKGPPCLQNDTINSLL
jgi:hypothetical protein